MYPILSEIEMNEVLLVFAVIFIGCMDSIIYAIAHLRGFNKGARLALAGNAEPFAKGGKPREGNSNGQAVNCQIGKHSPNVANPKYDYSGNDWIHFISLRQENSGGLYIRSM